MYDEEGSRRRRTRMTRGDEEVNNHTGSFHEDGESSTATGARIDDTSSSFLPPNTYDDERQTSVTNSNHLSHHQYNNQRRKSSRRKRMYHWWTDILSRVSRSASSLLNQHTPKLDDILDNEDHNSQLVDVSQQQTQSHQQQRNPLDEEQSSSSSGNSSSNNTRGGGGNSRLLMPGRDVNNGRNNGNGSNSIINSDNNCNNDENNETIITLLQEEIALLKERIHILEYERRDEELWQGRNEGKAVVHNNEHQQTTNHLDEFMHNNDPVSSSSSSKSSLFESESIDDIPYPFKPVQSLTPDQITRYSRQLLLNDGFGIIGQCKLLSSSIIVIGAGGIGSTVLLYLAAVGVGHITVVDYDSIEMSNLHRQIIHKDMNAASSKKKKKSKTTTTTNKGHKVASDEEKRRGMLNNNKAMSAKYAMLELNPTLSCTALTIAITAFNAIDLISKHDVIVDASDNPQTRYIINDACILANKPLVSGSAMGTEGQLTVYNYQPATATATTTAIIDNDNLTPTSSATNNDKGGAISGCTKQQQRTVCYRCLYPKSTTTDGCKSCSDNGVLGMVPGVIGILQAVEVIKILTGIGHVMHDQLVMYDSLHGTFMKIKKPPPRINCAICSIAATITTMAESEQSLQCARGPSISSTTTVIPPTPTCLLGERGEGGGEANKVQSISCIEYNNNVRNIGQSHILLDVRVPRQYEMCSLDGSINLPLEELELQLDTMVGDLSHGQLPIYCLCRRGIASVEATRIIQKSINDGHAAIHSVYNITGGLKSWVETVDPDFPEY